MVRPRSSRFARTLVALVALASFGLATGGLLQPDPAHAQAAQAAQDEEKGKEYWQGRYRSLLERQAQHRHNLEVALESYARAQRRNYPRGSARERFLTQADEARRGIAEVEEELARFKSDARAGGALPGWLYEVEEEPIEFVPAAAASDADEEPADLEGHNPIHFRDADDER